MRITKRSPDTLVIEEAAGTQVVLSLFFLFVGAFVALLGWSKDETALVIFGPIFGLIGLYFLLFGRTRTHRFERWRGMLVMESRGWWGSRMRELPLDAIADIDIEEIPHARSAPSYYVYYVTKQGERIRWADSYDGSKENTLECFHAGREFLGIAHHPVPDFTKAVTEQK